MPDLHPQIQRVLQVMAEANLKPIEAMTPAEARADGIDGADTQSGSAPRQSS